jgi:hypothetical protein
MILILALLSVSFAQYGRVAILNDGIVSVSQNSWRQSVAQPDRLTSEPISLIYEFDALQTSVWYHSVAYDGSTFNRLPYAADASLGEDAWIQGFLTGIDAVSYESLSYSLLNMLFTPAANYTYLPVTLWGTGCTYMSENRELESTCEVYFPMRQLGFETLAKWTVVGGGDWLSEVVDFIISGQRVSQVPLYVVANWKTVMTLEGDCLTVTSSSPEFSCTSITYEHVKVCDDDAIFCLMYVPDVRATNKPLSYYNTIASIYHSGNFTADLTANLTATLSIGKYVESDEVIARRSLEESGLVIVDAKADVENLRVSFEIWTTPCPTPKCIITVRPHGMPEDARAVVISSGAVKATVITEARNSLQTIWFVSYEDEEGTQAKSETIVVAFDHQCVEGDGASDWRTYNYYLVCGPNKWIMAVGWILIAILAWFALALTARLVRMLFMIMSGGRVTMMGAMRWGFGWGSKAAKAASKPVIVALMLTGALGMTKEEAVNLIMGVPTNGLFLGTRDLSKCGTVDGKYECTATFSHDVVFPLQMNTTIAFKVDGLVDPVSGDAQSTDPVTMYIHLINATVQYPFQLHYMSPSNTSCTTTTDHRCPGGLNIAGPENTAFDSSCLSIKDPSIITTGCNKCTTKKQGVEFFVGVNCGDARPLSDEEAFVGVGEFGEPIHYVSVVIVLAPRPLDSGLKVDMDKVQYVYGSAEVSTGVLMPLAGDADFSVNLLFPYEAKYQKLDFQENKKKVIVRFRNDNTPLIYLAPANDLGEYNMQMRGFLQTPCRGRGCQMTVPENLCALVKPSNVCTKRRIYEWELPANSMEFGKGDLVARNTITRLFPGQDLAWDIAMTGPDSGPRVPAGALYHLDGGSIVANLQAEFKVAINNEYACPVVKESSIENVAVVGQDDTCGLLKLTMSSTCGQGSVSVTHTGGCGALYGDTFVTLFDAESVHEFTYCPCKIGDPVWIKVEGKTSEEFKFEPEASIGTGFDLTNGFEKVPVVVQRGEKSGPIVQKNAHPGLLAKLKQKLGDTWGTIVFVICVIVFVIVLILLAYGMFKAVMYYFAMRASAAKNK